ncbi:MAG: DUF2249 domain-containing protein [Firmicutes bacterium]|jgi:uncharacterized protein (DUF2249 family)|nr:DUF2249 domain-containing protein [Bacillota bacterium]MCL5064623.1 DUF2249 domain-containing protein [Bacillota bacterium]
MVDPVIIINAPLLPPPVKHQTILAAFSVLPPGFSALLVNDHDPKPLLYQLEAEQPGVFAVEYKESGPTRFSILLTRN